MKKQTTKWQWMDVKSIKIDPKNPRIVKDDRFKKLVASLRDFPQMLEIRPIVVDKNNIIRGGTQRFKAAIELKWKEVPVIIASNLTPAQIKEFVIKDNNPSGDWDFDKLASWNQKDLLDWGLDTGKKVEFTVMPKTKFNVVVECSNSSDQKKTFDRLKKLGYQLKDLK